MLIPVGQSISREVTLIRASPTPYIYAGRLIWYDGARFRIEIADGAGSLGVGDTVVLDFGDDGPSRCRARVEEAEGAVFELVPKEALRRRDRRDHPRVAAELPLQYRVLGPAERLPDRRAALAARAHLAEADDSFVEPDPFVDVSGTGLRFIDATPPAAGDHLLVRLRFSEHEPWRGAIAEVVRVEEEVPGEWSVATTFVDLGPDTLDGLMDFIARRQEMLLGLRGD